MEPSDTIKELVGEKISRIKKYIHEPFEASVVLSVERYLQSCDITILAQGHTYKGHEETDDMYTSIDKVMDKLERQIDKAKGRMRAGRSAASQ
jgi:putative sigma-54 modulation protein